jgi:fructokinase
MRIGIDLGGTKTEVVVLDRQGRERVRERVPSVPDYEGTLDALGRLVDRAERAVGERCTVGLGIPGTLSPSTGRVKNANSTWLTGRPLDEDLAQRLGRPVRVMNDANCFVLSEASDGAAAGAASVFGVILGTGVGGGFVLDGRVLEGATRIAGEWGHNPLPWLREGEWPGPECYCGKRGCVETFCSGPGLERDHVRASGFGRTPGRAPPPPAHPPEGAVEGGAREWQERPGAEAIARAAAAGDPAAGATLDRYVDRLARSLATVVNVLDPEVVVLGGGVSNIPGLPERVEAALPEWVFGGEVATRVVRHRHGDSSGVRGAAWLWP